MKFDFMPLGGLNNYDNYSRLGPTEVSDSRNLLYERGKCFNRPGVSTLAMTGVPGPLIFGENVVDNATTYNMVIGTGNKVWHFPGVEVTAAAGAASFGNKLYNNACAIIGVVVFGNNAGGLVQWNPSGGTYVLVPTAPYRYVCAHQGRAVAAYRLSGGSALVNARTFAWCIPGDITNWTSATGSAGTAEIAELNDEITGLGVLHNVVVILRSYGIHLAYATGTLPQPYNIQPFLGKGDGCFFPSTAAWSDELVFYVSQSDVYMFNLTEATPIGGKIRAALFTSLNAGVNYRGFVTKQVFGSMPRWRYHLFPIGSSSSPHYIYDISEQKWSQHFYAVASSWAWNFAPVTGQFDWGPSFADTSNPPQLKYWDTSKKCEQAAYFTRYMGVIDAQEFDFLINDVLVRTVDNGAVTVTAALTSTLGDTQTTKTASKVVGGNSTGNWTRQFLTRGSTDIRSSGQEFILTITAAANTDFQCDYVALTSGDQPQGAYRGY